MPCATTATRRRYYDLCYQEAIDPRGPDGPVLHRIFMSEARLRAWAEAQLIVPLEYCYVAEEDGRVIRLQLDY